MNEIRVATLSKALRWRWSTLAGWLVIAGIVSGCATGAPPDSPRDICAVFRQRPDWYRDAKAAARRWAVSVPVMMAIMHHESGFNADARPPRTTCLFIFPGPRPSSAYGYPQALDTTWDDYRESTGNRGADRDDFADAVDFIGWYCHLSHLRCRIRKSDPFHLYLAYHQGHTGYNRRTYRGNRRLLNAARAVERQSFQYGRQLRQCEHEFQGSGGGCLRFWW